MGGENNEPDVNEVTVLCKQDGSPDVVVKSRFHTPTLLSVVKRMSGGSSVTITIKSGGEDKELASGPKEYMVGQLETSVVPDGAVGTELRKYAQFLLDHSNLKAIGVHAIISDGETDNGIGFAVTAGDCTTGQALSFVNCGDANIDEFVAKAKLSVPGRGGQKSGLVAPTSEQVKEFS